jgi:hypothetical protein
VAHLAQLKGWQVLAFLDDNPLAIAPLPDVPIYTLKGWPQALTLDFYFVVAIGHGPSRAPWYHQALTLGLRPVSLVHPLAYVAADAKLGAGAVVESQAQLGHGVIVDIGALVDHDAFIGDWVHLRPQTLVRAHQVIPAA